MMLSTGLSFRTTWPRAVLARVKLHGRERLDVGSCVQKAECPNLVLRSESILNRTKRVFRFFTGEGGHPVVQQDRRMCVCF